MMTLVAAGLVFGSVLAALCAPSLRTLLVGVEALDPATFATVATLVGFLALVTAWVPARRAARGDLAAVLRAE